MTIKNRDDNKTVYKVKTLLPHSMVNVNKFVYYNNGKIVINCEKEEKVPQNKKLAEVQTIKQITNVEIQKLKNSRLRASRVRMQNKIWIRA